MFSFKFKIIAQMSREKKFFFNDLPNLVSIYKHLKGFTI
jgi:hypothetical protein